MWNMILRLVGALGCLMIAADGASAIEVRTTQPELAIDMGDGFKAAPPRAKVVPGDRVYAAPGGEGLIVYDEGCSQKVKPGRVYVVRDKCRAGGAWLGAAAFGIATGVGLGVGLSEDGGPSNVISAPVKPPSP